MHLELQALAAYTTHWLLMHSELQASAAYTTTQRLEHGRLTLCSQLLDVKLQMLQK